MDAKRERAEDKKRAWLENHGRNSPDAQECDMCGGTGEIGGIECRRCLGTGVQS
jgi:hypothetical protein